MKKLHTILICIAIILSPTLGIAQLNFNPNKENILKGVFVESKKQTYRLLEQDEFIKNHYDKNDTRKSCAIFTNLADTADKMNNKAVFFSLSPKIQYEYLSNIALPYFNLSLHYQETNYHVLYNEAVLYSIDNKCEEAIELYDLVQDYVNTDILAALFLNRGIVFMKTHQYFHAISDLNMAENLGCRDFLLYYNRGMAKYYSKEFNSAISDFKRAELINRNESETLLAMANTYLRMQNFNKAEKFYKKAFSQDKKSFRYSLAYGNILLHNKKYIKAEKILLHALRIQRNDMNALLSLADALNGQEKYEEALAILQKADKIYPENFNIVIRLGNTYYLNEKYSNAIDNYLWVYENDSSNINALEGLCISYFKQGKPESVAYYYINHPVYEDKLKISSKKLLMIGNACVEINEIPTAFQVYQIVYSRDSSNVYALNGLGLISLELEKTETAIQYFEKAISIKEDFAAAYANLARCYHFRLDYATSIKYYEMAYRYDKTNMQILNGLAMAYHCIHKDEKAMHYMELAIACKHTNAMLLSNLSIIFATRCMESQSEEDTIKASYYYHAAMKNINLALDSFPDEPSLLNNRALNYICNGEYESALEDLLPSAGFVQHNNAGIAYALMGQKNKALAQFNKAVQLSGAFNMISNINEYIIQNFENYTETKLMYKNLKKEGFSETIFKQEQRDAFIRIFYYYLPLVNSYEKDLQFSYNYDIIEAKNSKQSLSFAYQSE